MKQEKTDEKYMRRCLQLARNGQQLAKPNPMVGAVIVSKEGRIIGEGYHVRCGKGHAEVNGLVGQTEGTAIVIEKLDDIEKLDFHRDIILFSQTTKPLDGFGEVVEAIRARISSDVTFQYFDTICRQVANRLPNIRDFALQHDCIYFVAGKKSSNGQMLFEQCLQANPHSVFITSAADIAEPLPEDIRSVGICGATSTPKWLMEEVAERVKMLNP